MNKINIILCGVCLMGLLFSCQKKEDKSSTSDSSISEVSSINDSSSKESSYDTSSSSSSTSLNNSFTDTMNVNIDFKTNFNVYSQEWDNRYQPREVKGSDLGINEDIKINFDAAKQTKTITNMPVVASKDSESYVTVSSTSKSINAFKFTFVQWKNEYVTRVFKSMYVEYSTSTDQWVEVEGVGFKNDSEGKFIDSLNSKNIPNSKAIRLVFVGLLSDNNSQLGLDTLSLNLV